MKTSEMSSKIKKVCSNQLLHDFFDETYLKNSDLLEWIREATSGNCIDVAHIIEHQFLIMYYNFTGHLYM